MLTFKIVFSFLFLFCIIKFRKRCYAMNFIYKIVQFLQGRYGIDRLCYLLIGLYCLLCFINIFTRSIVVTIFSLIIAVFAIYRVFSKNIVQRQKEAQVFENFLIKIKYIFSNTRQRLYQMKNYCFHKCPNCKAKLRLPRKRGKHTVCCPKCKQDFEMRVWF